MKVFGLMGLAAWMVVPCIAQKVKVDWSKVIGTSKTSATLQVVVNPPLRRGSAIHDRVFAELKGLGADYVRYVPWLPYPRLGVAELEPPHDGKTSWNFSLIDPMTTDFLDATAGHSVILNFSTTPAWLWETAKPVKYPDDPNQVDWNYTQGTKLRDPSMKELGDYYARLVSWYVNGGFTDEVGKRHESGHHYKVDYWEVLNEADFEHSMTPAEYTARYDAITAAIHRVAPDIKFVGLALALPSINPQIFEYFLNPKNHAPGTPLDMISYHFYATPAADETPEIQQHTFFDQADRFLATVRYIEEIRKRLTPGTRTTIDEIGSISADDGGQNEPGHTTKPIPNSYWNLSGAMYAYLYAKLCPLGIDVLGESQLVGYPTQYPSVSMVDWTTGGPNARFKVLRLLKDYFGPGDRIAASDIDSEFITALAVVKPSGARELLLINKRDRTFEVQLPDGAKSVTYVDQTSKGDAPKTAEVNDNRWPLGGLSVAVVRF